jgi:RimJ/RimL family protein N-acetyltransferase
MVVLKIIDGRNYSFSDEELRMLAEIETHPEVMKWNIDVHTNDADKMYHLFRKAVKRLPKDKNQIFLVAELNSKVVGFLGVRQKSKHIGDVGISIHPDYWNKGIGTALLNAGIEKAKDKGLVKLEAETVATNKAMIRIAEKAGFKIEDVRKMRTKKNGKYQEEVLLGIILR